MKEPVHLPTHFYLKRKRWKVELHDADSMTVPGTYGNCDFPSRTVEIWEGAPPRRRISSLVHEYLHAVEQEYGLRVVHRFIYLLERPLTRLMIMMIRLNHKGV